MKPIDKFFKTKGCKSFDDFQNHYIENPMAYDLAELFDEYAAYNTGTYKQLCLNINKKLRMLTEVSNKKHTYRIIDGNVRNHTAYSGLCNKQDAAWKEAYQKLTKIKHP